MKEPKLVIKPKKKVDKKTAKLAQLVLDHQWNKYAGVIRAMTSLKIQTEALYGIELPYNWGDDVVKELIKL